MPMNALKGALLFLSVVCARASKISCEDAARLLGQAVDGWKVGPDGYCFRDAKDLACPAGNVQFYDPETHVAGCCESSVTWKDEEAKLGFCCAVGHQWTGDVMSGDGGCCPIGMLFVESRCIPKPEEKKSCGCSSGAGQHVFETSPEPSSPDVPILEEDDDDDEGDTAKLDIHYGSCYHLSLSDGQRIGSNREKAVYTPGGLFPNIPFQVCRSTMDCSARSEFDTVAPLLENRFYLQDQVGRHNDPDGRMGWVAAHDSDTSVLRMKFTTKKNEALEFRLEGRRACEGCLLKLTGIPAKVRFSKTECVKETSMPSCHDEL